MFMQGLLLLLDKLDQDCDVRTSASVCESRCGCWSASSIIQNTAGIEFAFSLCCGS